MIEIFLYYEKKREELVKDKNPRLYQLLDKNLKNVIPTIPKEYIFKNSIQDVKEELKNYYSFVKSSVCALFSQFFLQCLPAEIWEEYIKRQDFEDNSFIIQYGIFPIQEILENENFSEYQKERRINDLCGRLKLFQNEGKINFHNISLEGWYYFVEHFERLYYQFHNLENMIQKIPKKVEISSSPIPFFSYLLSWKDIEVDDFSYHLIRHFFDETSHFEGEDFYVQNKKKYKIQFINNNNQKIPLNNEIYENLKEQSKNWKDFFFMIKWKYIDRKDIYINIFHHILSSIQHSGERFFDEEIYEMFRVFDSFDGTIGDILSIIHNIIIRMDNRSEISKYHTFLNKYKKYYIPLKFLQCPDNLLFPESSFQPQESMEHFETLRQNSLQTLQKIILDSYNPFTNEEIIEPRLILITFFQELPSTTNSLFINTENSDLLYSNLNFFHKNKTFFYEKNIMNDFYKECSKYNEADEYNKSIIAFINKEVEN